MTTLEKKWHFCLGVMAGCFVGIWIGAIFAVLVRP